MSRCFVNGCKSNKMKKEPGVSFHRFPRNEKQRKKWLQKIGQNLIPASHSVICSLHFEEDCFNRTLDVVRLREDSEPTRFPKMKIARDAPSSSSKVIMQQLTSKEVLPVSGETIKLLQPVKNCIPSQLVYMTMEAEPVQLIKSEPVPITGETIKTEAGTQAEEDCIPPQLVKMTMEGDRLQRTSKEVLPVSGETIKLLQPVKNCIPSQLVYMTMDAEPAQGLKSLLTKIVELEIRNQKLEMKVKDLRKQKKALMGSLRRYKTRVANLKDKVKR